MTMPQFFRKGDEVIAVQWWKDGDHPDVKNSPSVPDWPPGLTVVISPGAFCGFLPSPYSLEADPIVVPGDWIVGPAGKAAVVRQADFASRYVAAPETSSEEDNGHS